MVSQQWLNMNISNNLYSINYILISLYSHNTRKDAHRSKPVGEQERKSHDTFFVTRQQKKKARTRLIGTLLAVARQPTQELRIIPKNREQRGNQETDKNARQEDNNKKPATRAETYEEFGRWNASRSLGKKTLKNPPRADPSRLSKLDTSENTVRANIQGVWNTPGKTKETQWSESIRDRHQVQNIGGEVASLPIPRRATLSSARQII